MKPQRKILLDPDKTKATQNMVQMAERNARVLDGNVTFGSTTGNSDPEQNMECSKASGTTPGVANTEFSVAHVLGRVPITFFGHINKSGFLYASGTAWTTTNIYLKCSAVSAGYSVVIV